MLTGSSFEEDCMNLKRTMTVASLVVMIVFLVGCTLPLRATPTPFVFPTPNLTMTALFNPTLIIPPTVTPQPEGGATQEATSPVATATSGAATSTSAAAATVTPTSLPDTRAGTTIKALYVSTAPTIDGTWDEWDATAYPAKYVVFGKSNWTGSDDLEGSFRMAWDSKYLYVAAKVIDDTYVQTATDQYIYKGDSIEILLDTNVKGDFTSNVLSSDDYQLGISAGDTGVKSVAYLWYPSGSAGTRTDVKIAGVRSSGVYRIEAAIPWSVFGVSSPTAGTHYGFAFSVSDDDQKGKQSQDSMVSSVSNRVLVDPTTWGDLLLTK
jgi:hypothetical protein